MIGARDRCAHSHRTLKRDHWQPKNPAAIWRWLRAVLIAAAFLTAPAAFAQGGGEDDVPASDAVVLAIIDQTSELGLAMGRVATESGQAESVRSLGATLSASHRNIRLKLQELAVRLKIPRLLPEGEIGSYSQTIAGLKAKAASEFDTAFLQQEAVIAGNTVDALKSNLKGITTPEIDVFARSVLAEFEHHVEATAAAAKLTVH
jgi:predicted outer membrane protein